LKDLRKKRLKRILFKKIEISNCFRTNEEQNLSLVLLKAEKKKKSKRHQAKKEKKNHFEFFSLKVSTKEESKEISSEIKKKWMKIWKA
jgi:hypothetical protein